MRLVLSGPGCKKQLLLAGQVVTLIAGVALLGWPTIVFIRSSLVQWSGRREIDRAYELTKKAPPESPAVAAVPKRAGPPPAKGSLLAKLEVPKLQMSLVVLEGADSETLDKSIAHIEATAMPGEYGNIGIAGHRNTHFKKLE